MFIVTGGAGFIGANLVKALNRTGVADILVVDDMTDGHKFVNLSTAEIADYADRATFREKLRDGADLGRVDVVFHLGACSDTTEWDGRYMLDMNFEYSKDVFEWCQHYKVPLVYASSASVYGASQDFRESGSGLNPLNVYGWSKLLFDRWVVRRSGDFTARVVGLRYFNVYGPGETHKGRMASVVHHFDAQVREQSVVRLFGASHGYDSGEQRRDFIFVGDAVRANLWAFESGRANGLYNVGTGRSRSFNEVAHAVIACHGHGEIEYVDFPDDLLDVYQAFTEADITRLRQHGCDIDFVPVEEGVRQTLGIEAPRML
jgi:ADP-L-glycero-D-manno-heptose 6-epimerase